ncbi:MAG: Lrp/AsnC family transcriptional regulator [archaeon]
MQISPRSLGYNYVGTLLVQTDFKEGKDFFENLEKMYGIMHFSDRQIGKHNVSAFFALKTYTEVDELVQQIKLHSNVIDVSADFWIDSSNLDHPGNLIIEPTDEWCNSKQIMSKNEKMQQVTNSQYKNELITEPPVNQNPRLDEIDYKILNLLSKNSRMSFRKISSKIGLSPQMVIKRYNELKKNVVSYSSITLSLEKIGYTGIALMAIKVSNQYTVSEVFENLLQIPNVIVGHRQMGYFQIGIGTPFKTISHLLETHQKISQTPGVIEIQASLPRLFPSWPLNIFSKLLSQPYQELNST